MDACTLLWWWSQPAKFSATVLAALRDPATRVWVSAASAWEVSTRHRMGKYPHGGRVIDQWLERLAQDRFQELPVSFPHALRAGGLRGDHRDPFDRMHAAQSVIEGLPVATPDPLISALGAPIIW